MSGRVDAVHYRRTGGIAGLSMRASIVRATLEPSERAGFDRAVAAALEVGEAAPLSGPDRLHHELRFVRPEATVEVVAGDPAPVTLGPLMELLRPRLTPD